MMISGEVDLRDLSIAQHHAGVAVDRRRRTRAVRSSVVGLCMRGATIIAWLTVLAAPPTLAQTPPARVTPPAAVASSQAAPLSPAQEKALKPKDTFKECANCPEMTVVPAGSFTMGS